MNNKGYVIGGIWVAIAAIIIVLSIQGINFFGILILLGIACFMTVMIMDQGATELDCPSEDVLELKETVISLNDKIEELKNLLEE
jgi:hypothetical protein